MILIASHMRSRLKLCLLLISLLPMTMMAIYVHHRLPITTPDLYCCILPEQQSVTWSLVPSHFAMAPNPGSDPRSVQLDLSTGIQSTLPFAFFQVLDRSPDGTVTIQQFKVPGPGIEIVQWSPNAKSSRTLWRVDRLLPVLNHRYLISSEGNRFVAYDLNHRGSLRPSAIDICVDPQRVSIDDLQVFDGTNQVLVSRALGPNSIAIYMLNEGRATELTNWKTGGLDARAVIREGRVYSLSQDGLLLEVRDDQTFEVVDRLRLPANMIGQWNSAKCGQSLVTIQHPQTAAHESYRLQDMSPVPELNNWVPIRLRNGDTSRERFHIFTPADGSRSKLLVYDSLKDKIALEHDTGFDYVEVRAIGDEKLAIVDYRCGLTCKVIDVDTGNIVAVHRPLFGPLLCTLALNIVAIVWAIGWLRYSVQAGFSIVVDWFVLGAVIALPMLYRSWTVTWMSTQPSMNLLHACWLVGLLAAGYNFWFGRSRIVLRLCICLILLAASSGLLQLREWVHWTRSPTAIAAVWMHFFSMAGFSIVAMRVVTLPRFGAINLRESHHAGTNNDRSIQLVDLFVLTAVAALLIGSISPMKTYLKSPLNLLGYSWPLSVIAMVTMTTAAGLFFSRWRTAAVVRVLLVLVASLFVIGEWAIKLIDLKLLTTVFAYVYLVQLGGLASLCCLVTSAWAWRLNKSFRQQLGVINQTSE